MSAIGWISVVGSAAIVLAVGDVFLYLTYGVQATISRHTIALCARYPILAVLIGLAFGILGGHLFWPQPIPGLCP